jgi:hypothetical protein
MTRRERRRHATIRAVRDRLARLSELDGGLPMPYGEETEARLSLEEWTEYRERRARHLERVPAYDLGWRRPTLETAEAVWSLLEPTLRLQPEALFIPFPKPAHLGDEERLTLTVTVKQALVVVLDRVVHARARGQRGGRSQNGGTVRVARAREFREPSGARPAPSDPQPGLALVAARAGPQATRPARSASGTAPPTVMPGVPPWVANLSRVVQGSISW